MMNIDKQENKKIRLICDVDDVLNYFSLHCFNFVKNRFDIEASFEDITWGFKNLPKNVVEYINNNLFNNVPFLNSVEINMEMYSLLKQLIDNDLYDVCFATAVFSDCATARSNMLQELFHDLHPKNIIITGRKDLLAGDVMIDDSFKHIKNSICKYSILFNQPWNEPKLENFDNKDDFKISQKLQRCYGVKDLEKQLNIIEKEIFYK